MQPLAATSSSSCTQKKICAPSLLLEKKKSKTHADSISQLLPVAEVRRHRFSPDKDLKVMPSSPNIRTLHDVMAYVKNFSAKSAFVAKF